MGASSPPSDGFSICVTGWPSPESIPACGMCRWGISAMVEQWAAASQRCVSFTGQEVAFASCGKVIRPSYFVGATRTASNGALYRPAVWQRIGGRHAQDIHKVDPAGHLRTKEDVRLYLVVCAEEDPGDGSLIRAALHDIPRAQNISLLARDSDMSREGDLQGAIRERQAQLRYGHVGHPGAGHAVASYGVAAFGWPFECVQSEIFESIITVGRCPYTWTKCNVERC